jgi:hypothetical protein
MALTIQSPGVQINEIDLSLRAPGIPPTTVLVPGFAAKGPTSEPITVSTISEFEQIYGAPTNAAERYFYHTAEAVFNSPANIIAYRLPYGTGAGTDTSTNYSALVYPLVSIQTISGPVSALSAGYLAAFPYVKEADVTRAIAVNPNSTVSYPTTAAKLDFTSGSYMFGAPSHWRLTRDQYYGILEGVSFTWSNSAVSYNTSLSAVDNVINSLSEFGKAGIIILNKSQNAINTRYEGNYIGILDNSNFNPATTFDDINSVKSLYNTAQIYFPQSYQNIPSTRLNFSLSAGANSGNTGSISQVLESIPTFDVSHGIFDQGQQLYSGFFDDTVTLGLFKLRQSVFAPTTIKLDYVLQESYVASFDYYRTVNNQNGGPAKSFFIEKVDDNSSQIQVLINPYISQKNTGTWLNANGTPQKKVRLINEARQYPNSNDYITLWSYTSATSASADTRYFNLSGLVQTDTFYTRTGAPSSLYVQLFSQLKSNSSLFPLGDFSTADLTTKKIGSVPAKLDAMFNYVEKLGLVLYMQIHLTPQQQVISMIQYHIQVVMLLILEHKILTYHLLLSLLTITQ